MAQSWVHMPHKTIEGFGVRRQNRYENLWRKKRKRAKGYLLIFPLANSMVGIRNIFKSPIEATSAKGWQLQPKKPPSLKFGQGFEEWSRWRRDPTFFWKGLKIPSFHFVPSLLKNAWAKPYFYIVRKTSILLSKWPNSKAWEIPLLSLLVRGCVCQHTKFVFTFIEVGRWYDCKWKH